MCACVEKKSELGGSLYFLHSCLCVSHVSHVCMSLMFACLKGYFCLVWWFCVCFWWGGDLGRGIEIESASLQKNRGVPRGCNQCHRLSRQHLRLQGDPDQLLPGTAQCLQAELPPQCQLFPAPGQPPDTSLPPRTAHTWHKDQSPGSHSRSLHTPGRQPLPRKDLLQLRRDLRPPGTHFLPRLLPPLVPHSPLGML